MNRVHALVLICGFTNSVAMAGGGACTLTSAQLVEIAPTDQAKACSKPGACEFIVMERERNEWCAVQVWPLPHVAGAFQTLVISNTGAVLKRIGGA